MKNILIFYSIISFSFISSMTYNTIIKGNLEKIYTKKESSQIIFLLQKDSINFDFFEVINFYSKITIQKNNEIIGELDDGEKSFYFRHDGVSNYYMIFKFPINFKICGFKVSNSYKEYNNVLNSYLSLPFLNDRKYNINIYNKEKKTELISIRIPKSTIKEIDEVYLHDNGIKFIPISKSNEKYIFYYALIKNKLILDIRFSQPNKEKESINYADIYLYYEIIENISNNSTLCLNNENIKFYKINKEENNINFNYELSIIKNTKLYLIENNTKINQIKSNIIFNNKNTGIGILMLDSFENKGCFSVNFPNEKENNNGIKDKKNAYDKRFLLFFSETQNDYEEQNIENDYFECVETSKKFYLIPNSEKKVIRLTTSESSSKYIELEGIFYVYGENKFNLTEKKYLVVKGTSNKPICINILYLKKDKFEIVMDKKIRFKVVAKYETFEFDLDDVKNIDYTMTLTQKSIKNDIQFRGYYHDEYVKSRTMDFEKTDGKLNCKTYKSKVGYGEIELYFFIEKYRMHLSLYWTAIILSILAFIFIFIMCCNSFHKYSLNGCDSDGIGDRVIYVFCPKIINKKINNK